MTCISEDSAMTRGLVDGGGTARSFARDRPSGGGARRAGGHGRGGAGAGERIPHGKYTYQKYRGF
jgi:hypothetical protein